MEVLNIYEDGIFSPLTSKGHSKMEVLGKYIFFSKMEVLNLYEDGIFSPLTSKGHSWNTCASPVLQVVFSTSPSQF